MTEHDTDNRFAMAKQELRMLVLEFRSLELSLIDDTKVEHCPVIFSEFAVWLLDDSFDTLRSDSQRQMHGQLREMHLRRCTGATVALDEWKSLSADSLAASRLWPPEWLCAASFPLAPPIARAAATIALAKYRWQKEQGVAISVRQFRESQASALRAILFKHRLNLTGKIRRNAIRRILIIFLLEHTARDGSIIK